MNGENDGIENNDYVKIYSIKFTRFCYDYYVKPIMTVYR